MQKNKRIKVIEECLRERRWMWAGIITYEENWLMPQIKPLATQVGLQVAKNLAVVRSIHIDTFWNIIGQKYFLRAPKDYYYWLSSWFSNLRPFWTFFARFIPSHASSFQFQNIVVYAYHIACYDLVENHRTLVILGIPLKTVTTQRDA